MVKKRNHVSGKCIPRWKVETEWKDLPGDQVRALPMLIPGRLRADRVRQTSKYFDHCWWLAFDVNIIIMLIIIIKLLFYITMINFDPL